MAKPCKVKWICASILPLAFLLPCLILCCSIRGEHPTILQLGFTYTRNSTTKFSDGGSILLTSPNRTFFLSMTSCQLVIAHNDTGPFNTVVWTATFVNCKEATNYTLAFKQDGNLVVEGQNISNGPPVEVWSTNTAFLGAQTIELDNSGNLYIYNPEKVPLWQSFYHPTSVLLSGQYLVQGMSLTLDDGNVCGISYSLVIEPGRAVLYARELEGGEMKPYWEERPNNPSNGTIGYASFDEAGHVQLYDSFLHALVRYDDGGVGGAVKASGGGTIWRAEITAGGNGSHAGDVEAYYWSEQEKTWRLGWRAIRNRCEYPDACGAYGTCDPGTQECRCGGPLVRAADGTCGLAQPSDRAALVHSFCTSPSAPRRMAFLQLPATSYFTLQHGATGYNRSLPECQIFCLQSCSCSAFVYRTDVGSCYPIHQPPGRPHTLSFLQAADEHSSVYLRTSASSSLRRASSFFTQYSLAFIVAMYLWRVFH